MVSCKNDFEANFVGYRWHQRRQQQKQRWQTQWWNHHRLQLRQQNHPHHHHHQQQQHSVDSPNTSGAGGWMGPMDSFNSATPLLPATGTTLASTSGSSSTAAASSTGGAATGGAGPAGPPGRSSFPIPDVLNVVLHGYQRKLKTNKKKYFVVYGDTPDKFARLEYFDSEKKFKQSFAKLLGGLGGSSGGSDGPVAKRSIVLRSCFNINKRHDTKKHIIALFTKDDCFCIVFESEDELNRWLRTLLRLQRGEESEGDPPRPKFGNIKPDKETPIAVLAGIDVDEFRGNVVLLYLKCAGPLSEKEERRSVSLGPREEHEHHGRADGQSVTRVYFPKIKYEIENRTNIFASGSSKGGGGGSVVRRSVHAKESAYLVAPRYVRNI
uniref:Uncharacterized protein n=1 Tax=Anopheles atroparvus TaxID=41427 RepID=A0A182ITT2_ANOAO